MKMGKFDFAITEDYHNLMVILALASALASALSAPTISNSNSIVLGYRFQTETATTSVQCFIDPSLSTAVTESGRHVYSSIMQGIVRYYYYASPSVSKITSVREVRNDVDSLLSVIRDLESFSSGSNKIAITNDVLGYIRTINKNYDSINSSYLNKWTLLAGSPSDSYIQNVDSDISHGLPLYQYFGQFVDYSASYNSTRHCDLPVSVRRHDGYASTVIKLIDPQSQTASIDLVHLFASMDGVYSNTGSFCSQSGYGNNHFERDVISWNGDLQQAAHEIAFENVPSGIPNSNYSFLELMNGCHSCREDDVKADLDAMTAIKLYHEGYSSYTLGESLYAYYSSVSSNAWYRCYSFMVSATLETELENCGNLEADFSREVYRSFNICYGGLQNASYIDYSNPMMSFMVGPNDEDPSYEVRKYVSKSFVDFVITSASEGGLL